MHTTHFKLRKHAYINVIHKFYFYLNVKNVRINNCLIHEYNRCILLSLTKLFFFVFSRHKEFFFGLKIFRENILWDPFV